MMKCQVCENSNMRMIADGVKFRYYRCERCHWYSTEEKSEKQEFNYDEYKTFDGDLARYEQHVQEAIKILEYKFRIVNREFRSFCDIGCSEGVFVDAFNRLTDTNKGVGIEVSKSKIVRGRQRGLNIYSFEDAPNQTYDFVLLRHVIEHIDTPIDYLKNISKYISNGGVLCIETPNNENFDNILRGNKLREDRFLRDLYPPTHVCGFTPKTFSYVEDKLGLKLIKTITHDIKNTNFYYEDNKGRLSICRKILEKIGMGSNVVVFFEK